jgi:hypothetical protein
LLILLFQRNELLRLGVRYWWRASNGWDTTSWTQVFSRGVGEPVDPIFIGSTRRSHLHPQIWIEIWMGRRIVPISLPQPIIIGLLKIPLVKKSSNAIQDAIQENNNLQNKMNERTYHEVLSTVVHELLHPLWRSWLRTCVSTNSSIGLGSRPRDTACKEKIGWKLNIL